MEDANQFLIYRDNIRLNQFLMVFHNDFKSARESLLYHRCIFTLDTAIVELLFEKNRKQIMKLIPLTQSWLQLHR